MFMTRIQDRYFCSVRIRIKIKRSLSTGYLSLSNIMKYFRSEGYKIGRILCYSPYRSDININWSFEK